MGLYSIILLIVSWSCSGKAPVPMTPQAGTLDGKNVLFVYGGWEGHNPEGCRDLYVPWLESEGAILTISNALDIYTDQEAMDSVDLIIQTWTLGSITDPQLNGLLRAVENGTGFAGWHGGVVDAFRSALEYHLMTGAQFISHPGGQLSYTVNITDPNDPIMEGVSDFTVRSEQYYLLTDPNIEVLATTTFSADHITFLEGRTMPVIWKHRYGNGRVFVNTIGHNLSDHAIPEFETTMKRGMVWAAR